jgi:hypothetical protein
VLERGRGVKEAAASWYVARVLLLSLVFSTRACKRVLILP